MVHPTTSDESLALNTKRVVYITSPVASRNKDVFAANSKKTVLNAADVQTNLMFGSVLLSKRRFVIHRDQQKSVCALYYRQHRLMRLRNVVSAANGVSNTYREPFNWTFCFSMTDICIAMVNVQKSPSNHIYGSCIKSYLLCGAFHRVVTTGCVLCCHAYFNLAETAVAERLALSPPTKANWVQYPAGSLLDFHMRESCRMMPLVDGYSWESPISLRPFITALLHTHLNHLHWQADQRIQSTPHIHARPRQVFAPLPSCTMPYRQLGSMVTRDLQNITEYSGRPRNAANSRKLTSLASKINVVRQSAPENPLTSSIVRPDTNMRNPGASPPGIETESLVWETSRLTTTPPRPLLKPMELRHLASQVVQEYERAVIFRLGRLLSGGAKGPGANKQREVSNKSKGPRWYSGQTIRLPSRRTAFDSWRGRPNFCMRKLCRTIQLVGGFSWGSPTLLHTHLASPSSALNTLSCMYILGHRGHLFIDCCGSWNPVAIRVFDSATHNEATRMLIISSLAESAAGNVLRADVPMTCVQVKQFLTPRPTRVTEVSMEKCQNEGTGETGDPEKTRRPTVLCGTIPTCENPVTRPGIEPGSPWWKATRLNE
ncbi:hypothetical protein PR048_010157 [Dryococelus australis]|uniref:Uncharacterized protein n=1 Tax=Dryococelus australis TaxID=614101 RepID=A0ABQ9I3W1_9NEOP|nr:hypothetical protein PR048_010157 [Dryococelus australis]